MNEATPYQKRLKEVQEDLARVEWDAWKRPWSFEENDPEENQERMKMMLPLAIRQIEREAIAIRKAHRASDVKSPLGWSDTELDTYLKQQGYTE